MDSIETIILIAIALIVSFLILNIIKSNLLNTDSINFEEESSFKKINKTEFVYEAAKFWNSCGKGEVKSNQVFYLKKSDSFNELNKNNFFEIIKENKLCKTFQSKEFECGEKENTDFDSNNNGINDKITLPNIIILKCNPITQKIEIS